MRGCKRREVRIFAGWHAAVAVGVKTGLWRISLVKRIGANTDRRSPRCMPHEPPGAACRASEKHVVDRPESADLLC